MISDDIRWYQCSHWISIIGPPSFVASWHRIASWHRHIAMTDEVAVGDAVEAHRELRSPCHDAMMHDAMPVGGFLSVLKISQRKHDSMLFLHVEHEDDLCPCVWYLRSFDGFQAAFCQMSWFSCRENIVSWCQFSWCSGLWCDFSCLMIFPQFSVVVTCERPIGPTTINGFRQRSRRQWTSMNGTEMEMGKYGKCAWQEVSDCLSLSQTVSDQSVPNIFQVGHMSHMNFIWVIGRSDGITIAIRRFTRMVSFPSLGKTEVSPMSLRTTWERCTSRTVTRFVPTKTNTY